jgi:internalin A
MPDQAKPVARPWQRFLRLSVRALIVVVLVIGAGLGWLVRSARIQRDAVAAITAAGGSVEYDWERRNGRKIAGGKLWAPRQLVELLGVDYFAHVTCVTFAPNSTPTHATIEQVGRLTELEELIFMVSAVGDADLVHLKGLGKLSSLFLGVNPVTDAGLAQLSGLTDLSSLNINDTLITDAGMVYLKGLTKLTSLDLLHTYVTDAGVSHLKGLSNLSYLNLSGTLVTDAGLAHLKGLTRLSKLDLGATHVTDAGMVYLKGLSNLSDLCLSGTLVTDAGLVHLTGLTRLTSLMVGKRPATETVHPNQLTYPSGLDLYSTHLTDAGIAELKHALPSLTIRPH